MRLLLLLLPLASGCGVTFFPTCEEFPEEVGDDELLPTGFSARDVLDGLGGERTVTATWPDDSLVELSITAVRRVGAAEWVRLEHATIKRRGGPPFTRSYPLIGMFCEDYLRVPVRLSLQTTDGQVAVDEQGVATSPGSAPTEPDPLDVDVRVTLPAADVAGLPPFEDVFGEETTRDGDPLVPEHVFLQARYEAERVTGEAGWSGEAELDDGTATSWARLLLDWSAP